MTLSEWHAAEQPNFRQTAELCANIAEALHFANETGIVHRDLKPANIMIDGQGQPHLMDFGLAKRDAGEITMTMDGQVLGTPAYMSPEQARGDARVADRRSDVYSMGVVLYELIAGRLPFQGNARLLIDKVLNEAAPNPARIDSRIPADLATICLKCLEKDPLRRYGTAQELADDLKRFMDFEPIRARPISRLQRTLRWLNRNRKMVITNSIVGLAAMVIPIFAFYGWKIYDRNQIGEITFSSSNGGGGPAEVIDSQGNSVLRFTIPNIEPISFRQGAYQITIQSPSGSERTCGFEVERNWHSRITVDLDKPLVSDSKANGYNSVTISGIGRLDMTGDARTPRFELRCTDRNTNATKWNRIIAERIEQENSQSEGSLKLVDEVIKKGRFRNLDLIDGYAMGDVNKDGDVDLLLSFQAATQHLVALSGRDGSTLWLATDFVKIGTPFTFSNPEGQIELMILHDGKRILALSASSGKEVWTRKLEETKSNVVVNSSVPTEPIASLDHIGVKPIFAYTVDQQLTILNAVDGEVIHQQPIPPGWNSVGCLGPSLSQLTCIGHRYRASQAKYHAELGGIRIDNERMNWTSIQDERLPTLECCQIGPDVNDDGFHDIFECHTEYVHPNEKKSLNAVEKKIHDARSTGSSRDDVDSLRKEYEELAIGSIKRLSLSAISGKDGSRILSRILTESRSIAFGLDYLEASNQFILSTQKAWKDPSARRGISRQVETFLISPYDGRATTKATIAIRQNTPDAPFFRQNNPRRLMVAGTVPVWRSFGPKGSLNADFNDDGYCDFLAVEEGKSNESNVQKPIGSIEIPNGQGDSIDQPVPVERAARVVAISGKDGSILWSTRCSNVASGRSGPDIDDDGIADVFIEKNTEPVTCVLFWRLCDELPITGIPYARRVPTNSKESPTFRIERSPFDEAFVIQRFGAKLSALGVPGAGEITLNRD